MTETTNTTAPARPQLDAKTLASEIRAANKEKGNAPTSSDADNRRYGLRNYDSYIKHLGGSQKSWNAVCVASGIMPIVRGTKNPPKVKTHTAGELRVHIDASRDVALLSKPVEGGVEFIGMRGDVARAAVEKRVGKVGPMTTVKLDGDTTIVAKGGKTDSPFDNKEQLTTSTTDWDAALAIIEEHLPAPVKDEKPAPAAKPEPKVEEPAAPVEEEPAAEAADDEAAKREARNAKARERRAAKKAQDAA